MPKIAIGALALGILGSTAIYAQEKYSLKSPSGFAFSDFKGYEDYVSSARADEVLKVIVANPIMIDAYSRRNIGVALIVGRGIFDEQPFAKFVGFLTGYFIVEIVLVIPYTQFVRAWPSRRL